MTSNLLALRVENYKAVTLFEAAFDPAGGVISLVGKNGAGKTSVLDALESLLAGRKQPAVSQPVHAGAMEARVIGTFDDIIVTRVWKNGGTSIAVKSADGRNLNATEALDKLYNHIGLDPFKFSQMDAKAQVDLLLPMIGVDPAPYDAEYAEAYELRTVAGRKKDALKARLDGMPVPVPGTPDVEVSATALMAELDAANQTNVTVESTREALMAAMTARERAERVMFEAKAALAEAEASYAAATEAVSEAQNADAQVGDIVDVEPIRARIAAADGVNTAVRAKQARNEVSADYTAAATEHAELDARVNKVKADKAAALGDVDMPIPNMSIDPETMTLLLNGKAFADASTGEKIRTGFVTAMILNPDLRLITIRDASTLDEDNQKVIAQLAADNKFLVLMEVAGNGADVDGAVLVITDGTVSEDRR